ncbi:MAG: cell division protein FtsZ, partial [Thermoplasmatales archaeon]
PEAHKSVLDSLTGLRFNHLKHLPPEWKRILWWIEVPKDPTERRIIGVVNRVIKDVMTGLGLPFFEIPQGNFHIIKREDFEHYWGKNVTGCSCAGQQAMYFNADIIRQNPLIAVEAFCHESIHMVGNMVVEVEKGETEIVVSSYREGLRVFPPQKKLAMGEEHEHFSGLDEAVVAEAAKRQKSLVISIVTLPFSAEGRVRMDNALYGIEKLRKVSDTTIVIPNDKLLEIVPRLPLDQAFKVADEILMESLKGLTEIITKPGLVNLDYSDIQTVMKEGGVAMIGIGESVGGKASVEEAVTEAITSPLIEADISTTKGALVRIVGGEDMSVSQAEMAVRLIQERINPMARIVWGASVDPNLKGEFKVLVVLTGVNSPYFLSSTKGVAIKGARGLDAEVDSVM